MAVINPVPPEVTTTGIVKPTVPVAVIGLGVSVIPVACDIDVTVPDPGIPENELIICDIRSP